MPTPSHARALLGALAVASLAWSNPAGAATTLGVGADALLDPRAGAFELTLAGDTPLARHVTLGGRVGLLLLTGPQEVGVPLDLRLRLRFDRVYLDGLVGPWLVFGDGRLARFHAGLGFGLTRRDFAFGLEVGALERGGMVGVRLATPI
jgi:hypothetical protein